LKEEYIDRGGDMSNRHIKLLVTWFTLGNAKKAPGTIGTLGALPLYLVINSFRPIINNEKLYNSLYFLFLIAFFVFSVWICNKAEKDIYKQKDPQAIVIYEVLGFMTTMFLINPDGLWNTLIAVILGFGLFRLFDITKLGPINSSQNLKDGVGVVADDFLAGIAANVILAGISGWLWV
jgi:phosphatidylglycerophosphatase A